MKELEFKINSTMHMQYHLFLFVGSILMQNKYLCILIWEHSVKSDFCKEGYWRQNSNLQKSCLKLFPSVSYELWRYHDVSCVKQNPPMCRLSGWNYFVFREYLQKIFPIKVVAVTVGHPVWVMAPYCSLLRLKSKVIEYLNTG